MKDNKVKQKFLKLKEETDQFIKILQILFDTYEMFHIQGRFNYISIKNIITNTNYAIDQNSLINYHIKIGTNNNLENYFDKFYFIKPLRNIEEVCPYNAHLFLCNELKYTTITLIENIIVLGTTTGKLILYFLETQFILYHTLFQNKITNIKHIKNKYFIATDENNRVKICQIDNSQSFRTIKKFHSIYQMQTIKSFHNYTFMYLVKSGLLIKTDIYHMHNNNNFSIQISQPFIGFKSFIILKDQNHFVLYGDNGYLIIYDIYSYKCIKRFESLYIKNEGAVYETNQSLIIGYQIDNENAITIINLQLMSKVITIVDNYCMKVEDNTQIQSFYFYQDDEEDTVLCNEPKGLPFRLI